MLTKEFWGILFLVFVGWVLIAGQPSKRIDRVCAPVEWTGNLSTSLAALVVPQYQRNLNHWFGKVDYACEYMVWRLLYQEDWNRYQAGLAAQRADAARAQEVQSKLGESSKKSDKCEDSAAGKCKEAASAAEGSVDERKAAGR